MAFRIDFSQRARDNLKGLRKRDQQIVVDAVAVQLSHRPEQPTRQRKKLEDNELAPWELRVGDFRVFYDIDRDAELVIVVAVGQKTHNILRIDDEEDQSMTKVELEGTKLTVPDLAELVKKGPVILTRHGKPLAAVKDLSGSDWESIALANNPRFLALIEESRRSYREQGGISLDEIRQELGLTTKQHRGTRRKRKELDKNAEER